MIPLRPPTRRDLLLAAGGTAVAALGRNAGAASADDALTAVTLIHGLPGRGDELQAHLLSLAPPTRAEPGCLLYDLYRSPDSPHEFLRIERWASAAALEAHKRAPHLAASFAKRQREGWTTEILTWRRVPEDLA